MPSSDITGLTALATPQPTMLMYAAISPFNATDDRSITANALLSTITASITDKSLQFDDGQPTATVSAVGKGKIRYNNLTGTFQQSISGAAYVDFGGGGGGTPGAPLNSVQYNAGAGVFGGNAGFLYDPTANPNVQITATGNGFKGLQVINSAIPTVPQVEFTNAAGTKRMQIAMAGSSTITDTDDEVSIFSSIALENLSMGLWKATDDGTAVEFFLYSGVAGLEHTRLMQVDNGAADANFLDIKKSGVLMTSNTDTGGLIILTDVASPIIFATGGHAFTNEKGRFDAAGFTLGKVSSITGALNLANSASAFLTTIQAGNAAAAVTYTWPTNKGAAGSVLTDAAGDGVLSWAATSGGAAWSALTNPSGNLALSMAAFTTTFTWNSATGGNNLFTFTTGSNDTGSNAYVVSIETPGGSNQKRPFRCVAQGSEVFTVLANGSVFTAAPTGGGLALGFNVNSVASNSIGIGSTVSGSASHVIGLSAGSNGSQNIVMGNFSNSGGNNNLAIGHAVGVGGTGSIGLGAGTQVSNNSALVMGVNGASTAANQAQLGTNDSPYNDFFLGKGVTNAAPVTTTVNATGGSGTDIAGAIFNLAAGRSTGNATPARLHLQAGALATGSGTTAQTLIDRQILGATKVVANNTTTTIVNVTDASNTNASGIIDYCVEVFDGTNLQVETGSFIYQVINKSGAFSDNTITQPTGYPKTAQTSGTLTVTWTITGANPALIQLNANSSLTPSTGYPRVTYTLRNLTQQAVAPQ